MTSPTHPAAGGSYIRLKDGSLALQEPQTAPAAVPEAAVEGAVEAPVQRAAKPTAKPVKEV